ncbi:MAG: hypothetical protein IJR68_05540 [Fretibacterium sp.]|nr:hypothetical protein [Fretibacterium sp.]
MSKKFRIIAVLMTCSLVFSIVQPAFAWGETDKQVEDAKSYAFWGAVGGAALALFTGGLALIPMAGAAAVGAAAGGAYGGCNEDEKQAVKDTAIEVGGEIALTYAENKVEEMVQSQQQPAQ